MDLAQVEHESNQRPSGLEESSRITCVLAVDNDILIAPNIENIIVGVPDIQK